MAEPLEPDDVLLLEPRKVVSYVHTRADGSRVFRVAYESKVIEFEGDTLAFGQRVFQCQGQNQGQGARFRAGDAADGLTLPWSQVSELLESLLAEKILRRQDSLEPEEARAAVPPPALNTDPRAPMPPLRWRSLAELCELVSAMVGQRVRPDVAETVIGPRVITQVLRDDEGRQGGENGLAMSSPMLTDAVPTEWRTCKYHGSRFNDPRPMNVSSLRQVQRHMPAVLAVTSAVRARYLQRSGVAQLDLAQLCILADVLNVLPAWLLARPRDPILSGEQPAWAQSLAKTVAGIDMSLRRLVDDSEEHDLDSPVTSAEIHLAAEFGGAFVTATGVCSGTAAMIDRANRAFTGEEVFEGGDALLATCCAIDEFLDYGLACCRLQSVQLLGSCRAVEVIEAALASDPLLDERPGPSQDALRQRLAVARQSLDRDEGPLARRIGFLEHKFRGAGRVLAAPERGASLSLDTRPTDAASLSALLAGAVGSDVWARALVELLTTEGQTLALVADLQQELNTTIGRRSVAPVVRADMVAARRLWGLNMLSDQLAKFLGVTLADTSEPGQPGKPEQHGLRIEGRGASVLFR